MEKTIITVLALVSMMIAVSCDKNKMYPKHGCNTECIEKDINNMEEDVKDEWKDTKENVKEGYKDAKDGVKKDYENVKENVKKEYSDVKKELK